MFEDAEKVFTRLGALLPTALDATGLFVTVIDPSFRVLHANKAFLDFTAKTLDSCRGRECFRVVHGKDRPCGDCAAAEAFRTGEIASASHPSVDASGQHHCVEISAVPVKDSNGRVEFVAEFVKDVSEHARAEAEREALLQTLRDSEERYRTMVEHSNDVIWTVALDGRLLWLNPHGVEVTGFELPDWRGRAIESVLAPEDLPQVQRALEGTFAGHAMSCEVRLRAKNRGDVDLLVNAAPLFSNGQIAGAVCFGNDITERKRAVRQLQEMFQSTDEELRTKVLELAAALDEARNERDRAQHLERLQEDFVRMLSHDLRSPLNGLLLQIEVQRRGAKRNGDEEATARMDSMMRCVRRIDGMIRDLVESTRLESGQRTLECETIPASELIADLLQDLPPEYRERMRIEIVPPDADLFADRTRIARAVSNLLGNALKYSPAARPVTIRFVRAPDQLAISVIDEGRGIEPDEIPHLFERFYRSRAQRGRDGLGLGLYITRLVVEAHGGAIHVTSESGVGSTFTITLPATVQHVPRTA